MPIDHDDWHIPLLEAEDEEQTRARMEPYRLEGMTTAQEDALRTLAAQSGFKDLRGFANWMRAAALTYYDLIKVASPE